MFRHYCRVAWEDFDFAHSGGYTPNYTWKELFCRRDYGYAFESKGHWPAAGEFYQFSVERSPVGVGSWARAHERLTPLQGTTDPPMPFWTNADGGYVTGSLMAYTGWATEQMLNAPSQESRRRLGHDVRRRGLALSGRVSQSALALVVEGAGLAGPGRRQKGILRFKPGSAEFEAVGKTDPLMNFAKGHELIMKEKYAGGFALVGKVGSGAAGVGRLLVGSGIGQSHDPR